MDEFDPQPLLTTLAVVFLVYLFMPHLWLPITSADGSLHLHESGKAIVAARHPFRETGPPASMAKLIMLRHKISQTSSRKRARSPSPEPRTIPRTFTSHTPYTPPPRARSSPAIRKPFKAPWLRFTRRPTSAGSH